MITARSLIPGANFMSMFTRRPRRVGAIPGSCCISVGPDGDDAPALLPRGTLNLAAQANFSKHLLPTADAMIQSRYASVSRPSGSEGFTLIELLAVVRQIIGILAAILIADGERGAAFSANKAKTKVQFNQWATAVEVSAVNMATTRCWMPATASIRRDKILIRRPCMFSMMCFPRTAGMEIRFLLMAVARVAEHLRRRTVNASASTHLVSRILPPTTSCATPSTTPRLPSWWITTTTE